MDDNNLYDISLTSTTKRSVCQSPLPPPTSQVPLLPPPLSRNSSNNFSTTSLSLASPSSSIPKRVPSLPTLNETTNSSTSIKRPGDYYIQKINSSKSSLNFSPQQQQHHHHQHQQLMMKQRMSTDSLTSAQSSISDDHSIISSQFDGVASTSSTAASTNTPDSRLNSMTSDSFKDSTVILDSNLDSSSTISQPNTTTTTTNQALQQPPPQPQPQPPSHKPNIKSSSTSRIPTITPKIRRAHSISAMQTLTRTKSKFISSSEAKQRQKLRKKKYDENDNDDYDDEEISEEFLFNVPIIKNKAELYSLTAANSSKTSHENYGNGNGNGNGSGSNHGSANSSSVTILSRNDLVSDRDQYCTIKPCPLPGKLGSSTDLLASVGNRSTSHNDESIIEEEEEEEGEEEKEKEEEDRTEQGHQQDEVGLGIVNDDTTIISNISTYYNQQVEMKNKLARQNVMYKIPNFIKSNSSLEDLHLISLEKLSVIDSTRPSHLPPKSMDERKKHNQQIDKILHNKNNSSPHLIKSPTTRTSFNGSDSLSNNDVVVVYNQEFINLVEELQQATDSKTFSKKFQSQRDMIRTFAWTSNIPNDQCFQFLLKILSLNQSCQDSLNTIKNSFLLFETKFNNLPESIKSNKMMEFNKLCQEIMTKPLFKTIPLEEQVEFMDKLKSIWNIKAISESGLNQDEIFLISILLKVFPQKSCQDIYCLLELINQEVLTKEFKQKFNNNLLKWNNLNQLYKFQIIPGEFQNLSFNSILQILLQFNDQLPLSLSAPSTPIIGAPSPSIDTTFISTTTPSPAELKSCSTQLIIKLFTLLIIYSFSYKTKLKNNIKILETFIMIIFNYYHLNWNNLSQLIKENRSIKLNYTADQLINLNSFVDKWKYVFKRN
ncbi:hypothetical protein MGE_03852 [Candida albicans P75010]|nr:hypothetical protein MGE_03852 [Candida albicans P75010]